MPHSKPQRRIFIISPRPASDQSLAKQDDWLEHCCVCMTPPKNVARSYREGKRYGLEVHSREGLPQLTCARGRLMRKARPGVAPMSRRWHGQYKIKCRAGFTPCSCTPLLLRPSLRYQPNPGPPRNTRVCHLVPADACDNLSATESHFSGRRSTNGAGMWHEHGITSSWSHADAASRLNPRTSRGCIYRNHLGQRPAETTTHTAAPLSKRRSGRIPGTSISLCRCRISQRSTVGGLTSPCFSTLGLARPAAAAAAAAAAATD